MTFLNAWNNFWGKRFDVSERASRSEFWMMFPIFFVLPYTFSMFGFYIFPLGWMPVLWTIYGTFLIVTIIPFLTLAVRRFNDAGLPGWIPMLVIGFFDTMTILLIFFNLNFTFVGYIMDCFWLAYMFVLGACIAPSVTHNGGQ